jgi:chaperonin GroES
MTSLSARLASALAVWPLDREQRSLIKTATAGINRDQAHALVELLGEAEWTVTRCANFLMGGWQKATREEGPHATKVIRPLSDRVVVRRIAAEEKTAGGIIIPDTAKEKPMEGEVVAVGPGGRDESGKIVKPDIKVGDKVLFDRWSGAEVEIDGAELLIMKESEIIGVIERPVEVRRRTAKGAA